MSIVPKTAGPETAESPPSASATPDGNGQTAAGPHAPPIGVLARTGPREFSPEFSASRRQPVPNKPPRSDKLRWVLAIASLSIFFIGLWLVVAAPRFNL
jgi:hypothetical protein